MYPPRRATLLLLLEHTHLFYFFFVPSQTLSWLDNTCGSRFTHPLTLSSALPQFSHFFFIIFFCHFGFCRTFSSVESGEPSSCTSSCSSSLQSKCSYLWARTRRFTAFRAAISIVIDRKYRTPRNEFCPAMSPYLYCEQDSNVIPPHDEVLCGACPLRTTGVAARL